MRRIPQADDDGNRHNHWYRHDHRRDGHTDARTIFDPAAQERQPKWRQQDQEVNPGIYTCAAGLFLEREGSRVSHDSPGFGWIVVHAHSK
ncbi:MAG: hypothetical protein ACRD4C_01480 [Candidatus Acidiferrales bacterium]